MWAGDSSTAMSLLGSSGIDQDDLIPELLVQCLIYVTQRTLPNWPLPAELAEAAGNALGHSGCSGWETLEFLPGRNLCYENFLVMPWEEGQPLLRWGRTTQIPWPCLLAQCSGDFGAQLAEGWLSSRCSLCFSSSLSD